MDARVARTERRRPGSAHQNLLAAREAVVEDPVVIVMPLAGAWQTYVEGRGEAQSFDARYPALEWAHRWAQVHRPSLVRVVGAGGAVEDEWAYGAYKGIRRIGPQAVASR
jgi:hypothetical protein